MALTTLAFLGIYFGGLALSFMRGPIWGLYTYVAVFYLHPPSRWWGAQLPDLRWSLLAALVTLVCLIAQKDRSSTREPFFSQGLAWIFLLYVLWMWIQVPFVLSDDHMDGVILFTKYLVLLYLIYTIVDTTERVRDFFLVHVAGCFYLAWLAYTAVGAGRLEGVGGPGIDEANAMSMHFGTGIVVAAVLLMTERGWRFWFPLVALPFMLNGMMQGGSRGAFLGLIAGGLCLFWVKPKAFRKQFIWFGAIGAVLFGYLALSNDLFTTRILSLRAVTDDSQELDFSAHSRLVIIKAETQMVLDHPFGVGHAGTAFLSPEYLSREYLTVGPGDDAQPARSSHNTFMSVTVDQGVPGVMLLFALLIWAWTSVRAITRRSRREPTPWAYGAAISAGLMVAVVAGQFAPFLKAEVQFWLLALLASMKTLTDQPPVREPTAPPAWQTRFAAARAPKDSMSLTNPPSAPQAFETHDSGARR